MSIFAAYFLFVFAVVALVSSGPVNVRIETENTQDFHIGPEPRTRFDLVEEYRPLARAVNTKHARAFASSLSKPRQAVRRPQPIHVLVDIGDMAKQQQANTGQGRDGLKQQGGDGVMRTVQELPPGVKQRMITKSRWLDWTRWSRCENGERIRVRKCLSINGTPCEGQSIEKQSCFSAVSSGIKFAKDPSIIEREIRGEHTNILTSSHRRVAAARK
uniref:Secreted protein n=1 Tax=Globodera rostochiensis TaxID=31243 RepID=A0A914I650_GLORO